MGAGAIKRADRCRRTITRSTPISDRGMGRGGCSKWTGIRARVRGNARLMVLGDVADDGLRPEGEAETPFFVIRPISPVDSRTMAYSYFSSIKKLKRDKSQADHG